MSNRVRNHPNRDEDVYITDTKLHWCPGACTLFDVRKPAGVVNDACTIAVLACSKTLRLKPLIGFKN